MVAPSPRLAPSTDLAVSPADPPGIRVTESPVDHALTLLLAGEIDAALRWAAAALERAPSPSALIVTARLLDQMGRTRAAVDGLRLAVQQAVDAGELPLAIAAIDDLRVLGLDVTEELNYVAGAFCRGSPRLHRGETPPSLPPPAGAADFIRPLSPFLAGPTLASKATQILQATKRAHDEQAGADLPRLAPLPLFSALSQEALHDLLGAFQVVTAPGGHRIVQEGEAGNAAYIVARGEIEISRRAAHGDSKCTLALARLGRGAFFGEMALLSEMPSPATATATRPSVLLAARREALVSIAARRPEVAAQLAAHCRRNSLANLGWTSPVVAAVAPRERARLVERFEMRVFEKGDRLVHVGEDAQGLHLVVSGEVAIVSREWDDKVLLATLGAGETVGEVELVLHRPAYADAIAVRPTATLFLSRDEYASLVQDQPAILHGLYSIAVQRHAETTFALQSGSAMVADDWLLDPTINEATIRAASTPMGRLLPSGGPTSFPESDPFRRSSQPPVQPPPLRMASSLPPTSASLSPAATHSPSGAAVGWMTPVASAAFAALAASVVTILALRERHLGAPPAAAGAADSRPVPTAYATVPATVTTTVATPPPATISPLASPAASASAALLSSKLLVKPKAPKRASASRSAFVADVAASASSAPATSASSPSRAASASAEPSVARGLSASADEFGGRQ
jgi:CRP-like cAMP-binding protein